MSLKLAIHSKREWQLIKDLVNGWYTFEKMNDEEKWIVYNSDMPVEDYIDEEALREFEQSHPLLGEQTKKQKAKSLVDTISEHLTKRLAP